MSQVFFTVSCDFRISSKCACRNPHCSVIAAFQCCKALIVVDWLLHYSIQNFRRFFSPPEISATQHASFSPRMHAPAGV